MMLMFLCSSFIFEILIFFNFVNVTIKSLSKSPDIKVFTHDICMCMILYIVVNIYLISYMILVQLC